VAGQDERRVHQFAGMASVKPLTTRRHLPMRAKIALQATGRDETARGEQAGFQPVFVHKRVGAVTARTRSSP
jgi:hypothetical protein